MPFAGPVFISYNHVDLEFAGWLASQLVAHRVAVWFDEWEMRVGDSLRRKVERGIDTSAYLIIVLSPDSVKSEWVSQELDAAFIKELESKRVFVLPVLHKDCEIPLFFRGKRYADFRTDPSKGLADVLASIDRSEVTGHSREADASTYTDWTIDWKTEDGRLTTEIIINQHSKTDNWSIICFIIARPNDKLMERFQQYIDNDLEWYAKIFSLNSLAATVTVEEGNTDILYIDGAFESRRQLGWADTARDMVMSISVSARRLGIFSNMDTLFEYGSIVKQIVDEHNKRHGLIIPPSEKGKLRRFLLQFPVAEPYKLKTIGGASSLWLPKSGPSRGPH